MSGLEPLSHIPARQFSRKDLLFGAGAIASGLATVSSSAIAQAVNPSEPKDKPSEPKDKGAQSGGAGGKKEEGGKEAEKKLSPEEKMARRFPQPVRVSYLIGLPMLDEGNATLGHVRFVVRDGGGKVKLVINYGGLFGIGERLIAVPVEVCAMLGRQVAAQDMPRDEFEPAPTWYGSGDQPIGQGETIQVAVMRR